MRALLTWALGTGEAQDTPVRSPPSMTRGARPSSDAMRAPIAESGSMTRRIGRLRSDCVARDRRAKGPAGQDAGQQSHRGARVGGVEGVVRGCEPGPAASAHAEGVGGQALDVGAQRDKTGRRRGDVGAWREARHRGGAARDGAQHEVAMRQRLVARDANRAEDAAGSLNVKNVGGHGSVVGPDGLTRP